MLAMLIIHVIPSVYCMYRKIIRKRPNRCDDADAKKEQIRCIFSVMEVCEHTYKKDGEVDAERNGKNRKGEDKQNEMD